MLKGSIIYAQDSQGNSRECEVFYGDDYSVAVRILDSDWKGSRNRFVIFSKPKPFWKIRVLGHKLYFSMVNIIDTQSMPSIS